MEVGKTSHLLSYKYIQDVRGTEKQTVIET